MSPHPHPFRLAVLATPVLLVALATGCGDDDEAAASDSAIGSREEWCAVVEEIDVKFTAADTQGGEFESRRAKYEEIVGLFGDLEDGIEYVDESSRELVAESIAYGSSIAEAIAGATDDEDAGRRLEPIWASGTDASPGADWILTNCGVDIDG
jgi:hypothetical protein